MKNSTQSFAKALQAAHQALTAGLRKLEEVVSAEATACGPAALRARLGATRTHLHEHFRFEKQGGYMEMVRAREPRLERTIQQLGAEHAGLIESLDRLIEQSRAGGALDDAIRMQVRAWIDSVRAHESRENELVQNTFNLDLTGED